MSSACSLHQDMHLTQCFTNSFSCDFMPYFFFCFCLEMGAHLVTHGDGVKDVAFTVKDCDFLVQVLELEM